MRDEWINDIVDTEIVLKMIREHQSLFGNKPNKIILPSKKNLIVYGVQIDFHSLPYFWSEDKFNRHEHQIKGQP